MQFTDTYEPPTLTVDAVIFQLNNNQLEVLLIKRSNEPFKGSWALPGGYAAEGYTTLESLASVLNRKTGLSIENDLAYIEQLYTFDTVARDPRGHAVSVTYMGCGRDIPTPKGSDEAQFYPVDNLPELAYDHTAIIKYAHERLATKITYSNAIFGLMEPNFTLTQLQSAYEAVLGHPLDKRNFRKKIISLELIHETDKTWRQGAHRPAKLFAFNSTKQETVLNQFN